MARKYGLRVSLKGFMEIPKGDLDAQVEMLTALKEAKGGDLSKLSGKLTDMAIEARQTSYDPDAPKVERKPRKPKTPPASQPSAPKPPGPR